MLATHYRDFSGKVIFRSVEKKILATYANEHLHAIPDSEKAFTACSKLTLMGYRVGSDKWPLHSNTPVRVNGNGKFPVSSPDGDRKP